MSDSDIYLSQYVLIGFTRGGFAASGLAWTLARSFVLNLVQCNLTANSYDPFVTFYNSPPEDVLDECCLESWATWALFPMNEWRASANRLNTQRSTCHKFRLPSYNMSRYLNRLAVQHEEVLHADDDLTAVEAAIDVARDMALHGYLLESEKIVAPIWNAVLSSTESSPSFSRDFVREAIARARLEIIWKKAGFVP